MASKFSFLTNAILSIFLTRFVSAFPVEPDHPSADITERQDVSASPFYFFGWEGCTGDQPADISNAWTEVLQIGGAVTLDIDWDSFQATDFLGSPRNNQAYQSEIQNIIQIWQNDGTVLAWLVHACCDDYLRVSERGCPESILTEDKNKCNSRCWQPVFLTNAPAGREIVNYWKSRVGVYTTNNNGGTNVATINFCPSFFEVKTCADQVVSNGNPLLSDETRLNFQNYQCRGYIALHELFHIDAMAHRVAFRVKHITDRRIRLWSDFYKRQTTVQAYSPLYTKALARWTLNTGYWVVTNADNLAQYALSMWVTSQIEDYPKYPIQNNWLSKDLFITFIGTIDNDATLATDIGASSIGIPDNFTFTSTDFINSTDGFAPNDIFAMYVGEEFSCSDAGAFIDNTDTLDPAVGNPCIDPVNNLPIDLLPVDFTAPTGTVLVESGATVTITPTSIYVSAETVFVGASTTITVFPTLTTNFQLFSNSTTSSWSIPTGAVTVL